MAVSTKYSSRSIDVIVVITTRNGKKKIYAKLLSGSKPLYEMSKTEITSLNADNFNMYKRKIKSDILERFDSYALKDLEVASKGIRPNTGYCIMMDKIKIEIVF